ncbi:MAG: hypothetical protein KatS3mg028_1473 [Bacteroidia bacterium]|nr:MAG: hypothetical protein KatS3mg028_1473 [Bacteroidia bacterium]
MMRNKNMGLFLENYKSKMLDYQKHKVWYFFQKNHQNAISLHV